MENKKDNTKIILDSIAEAVVTIDKNFKITFINDAAKRITGFDKDKVIGTYCKHFFESDFCEINCPIVNVIKTGQNVYDKETELKCNSQSIIPIKLNAAVLRDSNGTPIGGVISFRDISKIKKLEQKLTLPYSYFGMIGKSKSMRDIFALINEISDTHVPVLITGETGTGKELIADSLYSTSLRNGKPYIKINCSVIPTSLISSELFGHVRGAFTDARDDRVGRFEFANGGTVFLDEIADLSIDAQPKLLRFLQEGTFERLGDTEPKKADVRIIAATNRDIATLISNGLFREDLFYRLNVVNIELPPLKKRQEDIPILIDFFIKKYSTIYKKNILGLDHRSIKQLYKWHFPGNIRELENIIEYAVIRTKDNSEICVCHLPKKLRENIACNGNNSVSLDRDFPSNDLINLLNKYKWNKTLVAKIMGIDRSTLWRRMKSLGI